MIFKDLKIGAIFRFGTNGTVRIKITNSNYLILSTGGIVPCEDHVECYQVPGFPIPDSDIKEFGKLAIGERFRFLEGTVHLVKAARSYYRYESGATSYCGVSEKCVSVFGFEILTFKDLGIGDKFQFSGEEKEFIKTHNTCCASTHMKVSATTYRALTDTVVKNINAEVER